MSYPLKSIQKTTGGAVYATDGIYKWGITSNTLWTEMKAAGLVEPGQLAKVSDNLWNRIANRPTPLTGAQVRQIVKYEADHYWLPKIQKPLTAAQVSAAVKSVLPAAGAAVDVDALAEAVADKLAERMKE